MRRSSRSTNARSARVATNATTATATPPTATAAATPQVAPLSTNATIASAGQSSPMATAGSRGTSNAGAMGVTPSAITETASTSSSAPMTVHNVPQITFHEKGETLFIDDKHIDATHVNHVPITRVQVENLQQQLR